jgi:hypothetical protein
MGLISLLDAQHVLEASTATTAVASSSLREFGPPPKKVCTK